MSPKDERLKNLHVLVTRPAHQANHLMELLRQHGATPIAYPLLSIDPVETTEELQQSLSTLDQYDIAVFISPNAVRFAQMLIPSWPKHWNIAAVGKGSARELTELGKQVDLFPEQEFNSEALLRLPGLAKTRIQGKKIIIFRGRGGREKLASELRARGAQITYAEVYQRNKPVTNLASLRKHCPQIDLITTTSNEALQNLIEMAEQGHQQWLQNTPLLVTSERALKLAKSVNFKHTPMVSTQSSDEAMVEQILRWHQARSQQ